jgi:hypothetical protein
VNTQSARAPFPTQPRAPRLASVGRSRSSAASAPRAPALWPRRAAHASHALRGSARRQDAALFAGARFAGLSRTRLCQAASAEAAPDTQAFLHLDRRRGRAADPRHAGGHGRHEHAVHALAHDRVCPRSGHRSLLARADASALCTTLPQVDPLAVCNDGSPAAYYLAEGSGSGAYNWLVYLEGSVRALAVFQRAACGLQRPEPLSPRPPNALPAPLGDSGESAASVATTEEGLTASPLPTQMFCWDETSCNMRYATHDYYMSSIKKPWSYDFAQGGACPRYGYRASPARADMRVISILPPQASSPRTAAARGAPPTAYTSSAHPSIRADDPPGLIMWLRSQVLLFGSVER